MKSVTPSHLLREYPELKQFRARIDTIDEEIASLLVARMDVVREVGLLKRTQGEQKSFIRPDREAIMLRELIARFRETDFPESSAAAIWRIIIGSSTATESPLNISVAHGHEEGSAVALAREYFGPTLPCRLHTTTEEVLNDMFADPHCVGVLPATYPAGVEGPWWWQMAKSLNHDCTVFAKLPFVLFQRTTDLAPVFLAGTVESAPSGQDLSLLVIEADLTSRTPEGISVLDHYSAQGYTICLCEAHGWIPKESEGYAALVDLLEPGIKPPHFLGSYAKPITVDK